MHFHAAPLSTITLFLLHTVFELGCGQIMLVLRALSVLSGVLHFSRSPHQHANGSHITVAGCLSLFEDTFSSKVEYVKSLSFLFSPHFSFFGQYTISPSVLYFFL